MHILFYDTVYTVTHYNSIINEIHMYRLGDGVRGGWEGERGKRLVMITSPSLLLYFYFSLLVQSSFAISLQNSTI